MSYIFIHGLGQDSSSWDEMFSFIKEPIHAVCPNLFKIINNKAVTYDNLYHAFSDYCNNISEPLHLCGLSLGGVLALNYAIDYPTRVQSLALISTQYKMPKKLLKIQNIIFRFMPNSTFENIGLKKRDFIELTNSMIDLDFTQELKEISCNTLVICGSKDYANKKASKILSDSISGAELCFINNAGHEVNIESPEKLANILSLWI